MEKVKTRQECLRPRNDDAIDFGCVMSNVQSVPRIEASPQKQGPLNTSRPYKYLCASLQYDDRLCIFKVAFLANVFFFNPSYASSNHPPLYLFFASSSRRRFSSRNNSFRSLEMSILSLSVSPIPLYSPSTLPLGLYFRLP